MFGRQRILWWIVSYETNTEPVKVFHIKMTLSLPGLEKVTRHIQLFYDNCHIH